METITVQYIPCGHVDWSDDPELIKKSEERAKQGFIDALTLPTKDCEECREYREQESRLHAFYGLSMGDS